MQYHYASIDVDIAPSNWTDSSLGQLNYIGFINIDTLDRSVYPRSGFRFNGLLRSVTKNLITEQIEDIKPFKQLSMTASEYISVFKNVTLFGSFSGGTSSEQYIPGDYLFYVGGAEQLPHPYNTSLFPFLGRNLMELAGPHAIVILIGLRYELSRNKFLTLRVNCGKLTYKFEDIFNKINMMTGAGLTAGMLSPIGPLEHTLMWESEKKDVITYVNIGYTF